MQRPGGADRRSCSPVCAAAPDPAAVARSLPVSPEPELLAHRLQTHQRSWRWRAPPRQRLRRQTDLVSLAARERRRPSSRSVPDPVVRLRTPAEHDVARKQALVLATLPLFGDRVLRWGRRRVVVLRSAPAGAAVASLRFTAVPAPPADAGGPDSRARGRHSAPARAAAAWAGRAGGSGRPTISMIASMPDREAGHEPRLHAAGQHAARHRPTVGHAGGTGSGWTLAVEVTSLMTHRPCCRNAKRSLPSAR